MGLSRWQQQNSKMAIQWLIAVAVVLATALLAFNLAPPPASPYRHQFCSSSPSNVTSLFVFGDDTVDAGNHGFPLPKHYGPANSPVKLWRMSDGRSLADLVAEHFHLPYIPPHFDHGRPATYTKYGMNFASFGCGIDKNARPLPDLDCKPLSSQVDAFYKYVESYSEIDLDNSIALISTGQNDIFFPHNVETPLHVDDLKRDIKKLVMGGIKRILITNMPPLGCYPTLRFQSPSHECCNGTNCLVQNYNSMLFDMVEELKDPSRGFGKDISIRVVDVHSVVQEVIARPNAVGIKNVEYPCCEVPYGGFCSDSSTICEDKTEYVFFDNVHLTERGCMNLFSFTCSSFLPCVDLRLF